MRASALFVLVLAVLGASAQASNATEVKTKTIKHTQPTCLAFRKLGNGFCRERYDAHGKPVGKGDFELYEHVVTKSDCADLCYEQGTACTGYEYNAHKEKCEIHHDYVGAYKKADGNECVQAYMTSDWEKCHVKPPVDPAPEDEYELVGHGFCREEYDHWGYPYGSGEYETECNAKKPCTEYECRQACSDYDWCKYYEFQDIDPMYMPEGAYPEDGQGRCELHKEYMGAYQASSKAVCYRKRQA